MAKKKKGPDIDATFMNILGLSAEPIEGQISVEELEDGGADLPQAEPQTAPESKKQEAEGGVFITAAKKEARSKRVNLLVTPSAYAAAKKKCDELGISVNECINQFLEKWGNEN